MQRYRRSTSASESAAVAGAPPSTWPRAAAADRGGLGLNARFLRTERRADDKITRRAIEGGQFRRIEVR